MKKKIIVILAAAGVLAVLGISFFYYTNRGKNSQKEEALTVDSGAITPEDGQIMLYGEHHASEDMYQQEFLLWNKYYHEDGMRDLFIEDSYYGAQLLNLWMQAEDNQIFDERFEELEGTAEYNPLTKEFYLKIKEHCPDTVFHGTDVGHQYDTTGMRYLEYLKKNGQEDSEEYALVQEAIDQGEYFYEHEDSSYRENTMTENFIREYDLLDGRAVMGIYGGAHTDIDDMEYTYGEVPCMANQLEEYYGGLVYTENLTELVQPVKREKLEINNQEYDALCYGKSYTYYDDDCQYMEIWRLEDGYEDFAECEHVYDYLTEDEVPVKIEKNQIFVIDYKQKDDSVIRKYYRAEGTSRGGVPVIEEIRF